MAVHRKTLRGALYGFAALAVASASVGPAGAVDARQPVATASSAKDLRVTLITGDRIVLRGGDLGAATVEPGPGRDGIGFATYRTKDHAYWIPADLTKEVGSGQIDRQLFDVAELVKDGYDDASTETIPILVTYAGSARHSLPPATTVTRQLPSIGGAAMTIEKKNAAKFLGDSAWALSGSGIRKIWLDGKRQLTLDQSVPQIGGPVAWQAGYTGKGVSIAVLDTGIDTTHPDLATQVIGERNFTTEPNEDLVGHGTHVASTIAGTAAASNGKYKGVAPDAKLYDGKVCEQSGCEISAILAGMEWAANEVKADIVNLSLGGPDTPDLDPLEEAVNRLTKDSGTLFVIAAGNSGPGDGTVESPGSADEALTVGNVTKQDLLNLTSSRGPRVGDGAVKPDITAPGTGIVAAKSKDSTIGDPVDDRYLRLSGTSMATPHVAGAAAILRQEHPSWSPDEVKGALMGSAKAAADQTSFQQGAGRVDVVRAIKQSVVADQSSVSFGVAPFPHSDDEPVSKTVTYRNLGSEEVTLDLSTSFGDPTGTPAPTGALRLSSDTLTVPAGGAASVKVTSDTKHDGPDGLYSGRIDATAPGQRIVVPVGVDKQRESYRLTVSAVRPDGGPADDGLPVLLIGVADDRFELHNLDENGTVSIQLPKGEYLLDHFMEFEQAPEDFAFYDLVAPSIKLNSDKTVVLDARKAKVVNTSVPNPSAEQAQSDVGYDRNAPDGRALLAAGPQNFRFGTLYTLSTGPKLPAAELTGHVTSQWGIKGDTFPRFTNSPYMYAIADYQPGEFVTGFDRKVQRRDLAIVDHTVNKTTDQPAMISVGPRLPGVSGVFVPWIVLDTPRTIRYYLDRAPGGWFADTSEFSEDNPFGRWSFHAPAKQYRAGRLYHEQWNAVVFGPKVLTAERTGDTMNLQIAGYGDAYGHSGGIALTSANTVLRRDGVQVAAAPTSGTITASGLPADESSYKLNVTTTQSTSFFSTKTDLTARFTSSGAQRAIPIYTVGFRPDVDRTNTMDPGRFNVVDVVVNGGRITKLDVQYSDDDGATWHSTRVSRGKVVFPTPHAKSIALRSTATDAAGNATTQTVYDAYRTR
ncbi:S8 family peptidase [Kribbella sp. NPDC055071]